MKQFRAHRSAAKSFFIVFFACAFGEMAVAQQKVPVAATPPMGWNSWNHFREKVSADVVRAQADAMVKNGMKAAGYVYVNIDDGWAGQRDARGIIHPNAKFPDMKGLADYIHSLGLRFGIYTAATAKTCVGLEGSLGHEERDAATYAQWEVDYVKVDWCEEGYDWFNGDDREARARFAKMGEALSKAGRPMVYSVSAPGPTWRWGTAAHANLWRTSIDIKDNWDRMSNNGFGEDGLERFAAPGHWNDPDMLEVGNNGEDNTVADATLVQAPIYRKGMSEEEYRAHMSLWCLLAAPLIVGADLSRLKPSDLSILTNPEVVAVDQDPLGIQGRRVAREGPLEVWMKPLNDGSRAVGLFNRELGTMALTAYFRDVGVGEDARVRDLWAGKDLGDFHDKYTANVPGHGVILIRVKPVDQ
jgi:alpha-galactosidase